MTLLQLGRRLLAPDGRCFAGEAAARLPSGGGRPRAESLHPSVGMASAAEALSGLTPRKPAAPPPGGDDDSATAAGAALRAARDVVVQLAPGERVAGACARSQLYFDVPSTKKPLVYSGKYDIGFLGLEKLHPFDSKKWGRIKAALVADGNVREDELVEPREATDEDLAAAHTERYLKSLRSSFTVAQVTELVPIMFLPNGLVNSALLKPLRLHTGGTVLAGKLALERGWAINLGGGFHHAYDDEGGGFCAYADITMCIRFARHRLGISRVMIIDLDAHQGNGPERDFMGDPDIFILDVYNSLIYPQDFDARRGIALSVELRNGADDTAYLPAVEQALAEAATRFRPELIIYNAGTDVLQGDPLGRLCVSPGAVIRRDEMVFKFARELGSPIVMVTSGGYQRTNAGIIAKSIQNLARHRLIDISPGAAGDVSGAAADSSSPSVL